MALNKTNGPIIGLSKQLNRSSSSPVRTNEICFFVDYITPVRIGYALAYTCNRTQSCGHT